jgi:hypothetical protein
VEEIFLSQQNIKIQPGELVKQEKKVVSPPTSRLVSDLIDAIHLLNVLSESKLGCKIFKANSKLLNDLRKKVSSRDNFVQRILGIGTIIDEVYHADLRNILLFNIEMDL